jgi:hypothetical protein
MKRIGYLAALGGGAAERRLPALRPPHRLFPLEPVPGDAPHVPAAVAPSLASSAAIAPPPAAPVVETPFEKPAAQPAPVEREPRDVQASALPAPVEPHRVPSAPVPLLAARRPPEAEAEQAPIEAARTPRRAGPVHLARPTRHALGAEPVDLPADGPAPAAALPTPTAPVRKRTPAALEPSRRSLRVEPPPAAPRAAPRSTTGAQLRIGTIEVTVVPPPPTPPAAAPAPPQARPAAARAAAPAPERPGSAGRWYGLAQR